MLRGSGLPRSSLWARRALITNVKRVIQAVFWMFGPACIGLLYPAGFFLHPRTPRDERRIAVFLLLLMVLPCVFFFLFLFDPLGYLLVYVTPLVLLVARGFTVVTENISHKYAHGRAGANFGLRFLATALVIVTVINCFRTFQRFRHQRRGRGDQSRHVSREYSRSGAYSGSDKCRAILPVRSRLAPPDVLSA